MIGVEDGDAVEQIPGLVGLTAPDMNPARRFGLDCDLPSGEPLEHIRLGQQRMVPDRRRRHAAIGESGAVGALEPPDRRRRPHLDRAESDGLGSKGDVDLQCAARGHQRVERVLGVADESNQEVLGARRNVVEHVASAGVGGRGAIEIGEGDEGAREGLAGGFIRDHAHDPRLGRLKCEQEQEMEHGPSPLRDGTEHPPASIDPAREIRAGGGPG